jgi:beta-alanine--pyruvate transaminase
MLAKTLDSFWMPFTDNRGFKSNPRMLVAAEGMYYRSHDGRQILDGTAGLWCSNAGHNRRPITEAIQRQAAELDFAPSFQLGHPLSFAMATAVSGFLPDGMSHVFFTNSGSEAVDTALKIALAFHRANGDGQRTRLIGRERGYHGTNFGGISVGGIVGNRRSFGPLLPGVDHLPHTLNIKEAGFSRGQPLWGAHLAEDLERIIALHGAETIAAVIVEPLAGSTGVLVPPRGYLERIRAITTAHGILLIFDEVITGFGRLGAATAAELLGVMPDLMSLAKGITNATVPMGAVGVSDWIHDAILNAAAPGIELFHGYTYSGHPLACAAGLATLKLYADEQLFQRSARLAPWFEEAVHRLADAAHVVDVRNLGLVAGIELAPRPGAPGRRAMEVFHHCFDHGVLIRVTGDIIALSPPLIVDEAQIDRIVEQIRASLARVA